MVRFKYAPESIPPLDEEQWAALEKELGHPPTKGQIKMFERARRVAALIRKIPEDDMLKELLRLQGDFQEKYKKRFRFSLHRVCTAMASESLELWAKSKGKWWSKKSFPKETQVEELVDVLHFFLLYMIKRGITADELFEAYKVKLAENYRRQEQGY